VSRNKGGFGRGAEGVERTSTVPSPKGEPALSILLIILIVIVVLALLGFFGRGRLG